MTIIIPAYEPDEALVRLLTQLQSQTRAQILVVNDGSSDACRPVFEQAQALGCTVLSHAVNRGKGAALKTAFAFLSERGVQDEIICTADADGQHLPHDIIRCLEEAKANPDSLVLGSRKFTGNVPLRSRFGNAASRLTFHLLMGTRVYDTQTGLRAFSSSLLPLLLSVSANRYEYEMDVLCLAAKKKIPIREVEIETVYLEQNRSSHFHPLRDAMRVYGLLLKNALGRLFLFVSFLLSSSLALVVDLLTYSILIHFLFAPLIEDVRKLEFLSLLIARILSSFVNYLVNRKWVFSSMKNPAKTLTLYALLAVFTFFCHEWLNALFFITLSLPALLSLILAQTLFFPVNFLIQKYFIFPKK